jgi:uncharacterized membrane protein
MKPDEFIAQLDEARLVDAIAAAERTTTGEIRLCISHRRREDALAAARARFRKLGMHRTRQRNGVLIYIVPLTQSFAVWGDEGVHEKSGGDFWRAVVDGMKPLVQQAKYTEALIYAVQQVAEILAKHFPPDANDRNELSNRLLKD